MKIILRSSSLLFTAVCITFNAPIARVNRKAEKPERKPAVPQASLEPKSFKKTAS